MAELEQRTQVPAAVSYRVVLVGPTEQGDRIIGYTLYLEDAITMGRTHLTEYHRIKIEVAEHGSWFWCRGLEYRNGQPTIIK